MNTHSHETEALKSRVLSQNGTFKTAFTATMGFYTAQLVVKIMGIGTFILIGVVAYKLFN